MSYNKPKGFKATPPFFEAAESIIRHPNCSEPQRDFIQSIANTCSKNGWVSYKQAAAVGGAYKHVVNNGVYVQHDWWS